MEVKKAYDGLLTNAEVLELLAENRKGRPAKNTNFLLGNREFIEINSVSYLKDMKTIKSTKTSLECIKRIKSIAPDLTEAEVVQIVNLLPSQAVELHAVRKYYCSSSSIFESFL